MSSATKEKIKSMIIDADNPLFVFAISQEQQQEEIEEIIKLKSNSKVVPMYLIT